MRYRQAYEVRRLRLLLFLLLIRVYKLFKLRIHGSTVGCG
jgi:hypothetical protein